MPAIIDIVDGDDWKGLYIEGDLVMQAYDLDVRAVLSLLENQVVETRGYHYADLDWLGSVSHLPNKLKDVILAHANQWDDNYEPEKF